MNIYARRTEKVIHNLVTSSVDRTEKTQDRKGQQASKIGLKTLIIQVFSRLKRTNCLCDSKLQASKHAKVGVESTELN